MKRLLGVWQGTGIATFPTIETTHYREILTFQPHEADAILHVEQKTWRLHADQSESLLYWESGFIRQLSASTCEWINAQNNGRTEVLKGDMIADGDTLCFNLKSVTFSNDSRMLQSTRSIEINGDTLSYTLAMAIQAEPTLQQHLTAQLRRISEL